MLGKSVHDRRSDAVKTARGCIGLIVEFASGMKRCEHHTLRRYALCMHINRNSAAIVLHRTGSVRFQCHPDRVTVSRQVLVHGIVYNLVDQVVQSSGRCTSDVHSRSGANRFQSLQYPDAGSVIMLLFCHE